MKRTVLLFIIRWMAKLGFIKTPYGDYQAAMGDAGDAE
jgi:hypothetical protein